MVIDHIGIVVKSMESSIIHWQDCFGYKQLTNPVINSKQRVKVVFMVKINSMTIKLIEPVGEDSPIYQYAREGGGLHHLCFRCDNMTKEISFLKTNGYRMFTAPEPGEAFGNNDIAFLLSSQRLNIELIDTGFKAEMIEPDIIE